MLERRKSARSRILKSAKLILGRTSIIDCAVRNLTNTGARIQVANTVNLPQDFEMNFRRLPLDQTMPACLANSDRNWRGICLKAAATFKTKRVEESPGALAGEQNR